MAVDAGRTLRAPKGEARLPRVPRRAEAVAMLDAAQAAVSAALPGEGDDPIAGALARRDVAVLELLYGAGLRVE